MKSEILLHWMSHRGRGSWSSFRQALSGLADEISEVEADALRYGLSDLGYADFFPNDEPRWQVTPPRLIGLCGVPETALLCGARSPDWLAACEQAARQHGCVWQTDSSKPQAPLRVTIAGSATQLAALAQTCRINYQPDWSLHACLRLAPVTDCLGAPQDEPMNWQVKSFDLARYVWQEGALSATAREYKRPFGLGWYFLCDPQERLYLLDKRTAIYAAAAQQSVRLAKYDLTGQTLRVPRQAPLPHAYARSASLCSGWPPRVRDHWIYYEGVTLEIAARLLALVGQPHPGFLCPA